jgi:hypothetical protein
MDPARCKKTGVQGLIAGPDNDLKVFFWFGRQVIWELGVIDALS